MVSGKIRRWEYKQGWNLVRGNMDKHKKYRDKTAGKRGGEGEEMRGGMVAESEECAVAND